VLPVSHEVVGEPSPMVARAVEGNCDDRRPPGCSSNLRIVSSTSDAAPCIPSGHDEAVSDESQLGQCRVQCELKSFIGHGNTSGIMS